MSMTTAYAAPQPDESTRRPPDPYRLGRGRGLGGGDNKATGHGSGGPSPRHIVVGYGFWIFILSDIITFSTLFATYAVLRDATAGGPSGADLFERGPVALETTCLLLSSFTCGVAAIAMRFRNLLWFEVAMLATFLGLELHEFVGLLSRGAGPGRSAFLSAFFALVGCHGAHVTVGLLWSLTMMAQTVAKGFRDDVVRRTTCWTLFWHALDIVWVGVFTVVYLMGVAA